MQFPVSHYVPGSTNLSMKIFRYYDVMSITKWHLTSFHLIVSMQLSGHYRKTFLCARFHKPIFEIFGNCALMFIKEWNLTSFHLICIHAVYSQSLGKHFYVPGSTNLSLRIFRNCALMFIRECLLKFMFIMFIKE